MPTRGTSGGARRTTPGFSPRRIRIQLRDLRQILRLVRRHVVFGGTWMFVANLDFGCGVFLNPGELINDGSISPLFDRRARLAMVPDAAQVRMSVCCVWRRHRSAGSGLAAADVALDSGADFADADNCLAPALAGIQQIANANAATVLVLSIRLVICHPPGSAIHLHPCLLALDTCHLRSRPVVAGFTSRCCSDRRLRSTKQKSARPGM